MTRHESNQALNRTIHFTGVSALVIAAFFLGRYSTSISQPESVTSVPIDLGTETATGPRRETTRLEEEQWQPPPLLTRIARPRRPSGSSLPSSAQRIEEGLKASEWEHHRRFQPRSLDSDWQLDTPRSGPDASNFPEMFELQPADGLGDF